MKKNIFFLEYLSVKFDEQKILLLSLGVLQKIKKKKYFNGTFKRKKRGKLFLHFFT